MHTPTYTVSRPKLSSLEAWKACESLWPLLSHASSSRRGTYHCGLYQITLTSKNQVRSFLVVLPPGVDPKLLRDLSSGKSPYFQLFTQLLSCENGDSEPLQSMTSAEPSASSTKGSGTPRQKASASSSQPGKKSKVIYGSFVVDFNVPSSKLRSTSKPTSESGFRLSGSPTHVLKSAYHCSGRLARS